MNTVWLTTDTLTGLMAAPNLIALLVLSPLIFKMTREYFAKLDAGEGKEAAALAAINVDVKDAGDGPPRT